MIKSRFLILINSIIVLLIVFSCNPKKDAAVLSIFPSPPDTSNLLVLANYISPEDIAYIVAEKTTLKNGETRKKGIVSIPLNYDDFRGHSLDEVYWNRISIVEGDFRGDYFRKSKCANSDFSFSDFRVADMQWADFSNSVLKSCNFEQAKMFFLHVDNTDFSGTSLKGANMFGIEGYNVNFRNCNFSNALMKEAELIDSDFTGSVALKTNFIMAVLIGSKADSADFSYSEFMSADLKDASFINSRFIDVNFQGANLQDADFSGADLKNCNFMGAEFVNTIFVGAINIPDELKQNIVDDRYTGVLGLGKATIDN